MPHRRTARISPTAPEKRKPTGMADDLTVPFQYQSEVERDELSAIAADVRRRAVAGIASFLAAGRALVDARAKLGYGRFGPWLTHEFGERAPRTLRTYMQAAELFDGVEMAESAILPLATVLALSKAPVDDRARLVERACAEQWTARDMRSAIAGTKPPATSAPPWPPLPPYGLSEYGGKESVSAVEAADHAGNAAREGRRAALARSLTATLVPTVERRAEAAVQAAADLATELADAVGRDHAGRPGGLGARKRAKAATKAACIRRGLAELVEPTGDAAAIVRSGQWVSVDVALAMVEEGRIEEGAEALWRAVIPPGGEPGWRAAYEAARHAAKWPPGLDLGKANAREMGQLAEEALAANPYATWAGALTPIARHARDAQIKGRQADGREMIAAGSKALKILQEALRR